jgi:hypothetical protein
VRVDPKPEQSERALVEVPAAENDAPVRPPTLNPALLPFGELSPPAFERLVAAVVLYVDGLQQVIPEGAGPVNPIVLAVDLSFDCHQDASSVECPMPSWRCVFHSSRGVMVVATVRPRVARKWLMIMFR